MFQENLLVLFLCAESKRKYCTVLYICTVYSAPAAPSRDARTSLRRRYLAEARHATRQMCSDAMRCEADAQRADEMRSDAVAAESRSFPAFSNIQRAERTRSCAAAFHFPVSSDSDQSIGSDRCVDVDGFAGRRYRRAESSDPNSRPLYRVSFPVTPRPRRVCVPLSNARLERAIVLMSCTVLYTRLVGVRRAASRSPFPGARRVESN